MNIKSIFAVAIVAAVGAARTFVAAQEASPVASPSALTPTAPISPITIRPIRLEIDRKIPESMQLYVGSNEGTEVVLYLKADGKTMLDSEKSANILTKFADDTGTDLTKAAAPVPSSASRSAFAARNPLQTSLRVSDDGQTAALTLRSSILPAADATKIILRGALPINCGTHSVKDTQNNVALTKDAVITIAGHPAKVDSVEDMGAQMVITISSNQSFSTIKTVRFLDADGHEIKSKVSSRGSYGINGSMTYSVSYALDEKVTKADVECNYWDKAEVVTVPIDLVIGVGI